MIIGFLKKWQTDSAISNVEFAETMGISKSAYEKRKKNPFEIRLKEVMKAWDEVAVSPEEQQAFWREVRGEWERTH